MPATGWIDAKRVILGPFAPARGVPNSVRNLLLGHRGLGQTPLASFSLQTPRFAPGRGGGTWCPPPGPQRAAGSSSRVPAPRSGASIVPGGLPGHRGASPDAPARTRRTRGDTLGTPTPSMTYSGEVSRRARRVSRRMPLDANGPRVLCRPATRLIFEA